jgi:RNA polymerase sigma-70 factor (ECF subfamily)
MFPSIPEPAPDSSMHTTPASLLERLRRTGEQAAWEQFVKLYSPLLLHWARRLGLKEPDARDLVQDVFAILVERLPEFRYDRQKRFRGWLWTVTVNKWRERQRRHAAARREVGDAGLSELSVPDTMSEVDEAEYRQFLTRRAVQLMRADFQPATWRAFWECAVESRAAADVARELGITENAVYLAKARVLRRLRKELEGLLD